MFNEIAFCSKLLYHVMWVATRFLFFKQKTAYEMRISDWSSDVCSSDLRHGVRRTSKTQSKVNEVNHGFRTRSQRIERRRTESGCDRQQYRQLRHGGLQGRHGIVCRRLRQLARGSGHADRKSVV